MANQLLLVEDVEDLGRSGDIVSVKPGYARNFLIPQKKAVIADKFTLRMQDRLQEERKKQAAIDKKESEDLAARLHGSILTTIVKVDPDGHMYGSVGAQEIVRLFEKEGIPLERKQVLLPQPIKQLGSHLVQIRLKEGVPVQINLDIVSE